MTQAFKQEEKISVKILCRPLFNISLIFCEIFFSIFLSRNFSKILKKKIRKQGNKSLDDKKDFFSLNPFFLKKMRKVFLRETKILEVFNS